VSCALPPFSTLASCHAPQTAAGIEWGFFTLEKGISTAVKKDEWVVPIIAFADITLITVNGRKKIILLTCLKTCLILPGMKPTDILFFTFPPPGA
jgi:hypothetical protein